MLPAQNQRLHSTQLSAEEREKLREKVIKNVRAVLLPEKHGMLLDKLNQEYKDIIGEDIPWRKLGYASFDNFVKANRQLLQVEVRGDGHIWVHGVPTEETQHISNMVSMQKYKKRASDKPKPARKPLHSEKWSPPTTVNFTALKTSQLQTGKHSGNTRPGNGINSTHGCSSRISGAQYNRRYPQSGGSGRFAGGGQSSPAFKKQEQTRPPSTQAQTLRIPNMSYNNNQNNQHVRVPKQQSLLVQNGHNNSNRRNAPTGNGNANFTISSMPYRQGPISNSLNQNGGRNPNVNYDMSTSSRNDHMPKLTHDQYKVLLQEYFNKQNFGAIEFKTAMMESKVSSSIQGTKNYKSSKPMKRYISTVKVDGKNYQTFPEDFATSEAAEEAAAKLACIQLNIDESTVFSEGDTTNKHVEVMAEDTKKIGSATRSPLRPNDTDFGEWISPANDHKTNSQNDLNETNENNMHKYVDRILQLVGARTNGVWSTQIDIEYSQSFDDKLPDKWPDKIEKLEYGQMRLRVDRPIPGRCIILPNLEYKLPEISKDSDHVIQTYSTGKNSKSTSPENVPEKVPTSIRNTSSSLHQNLNPAISTSLTPSPAIKSTAQNLHETKVACEGPSPGSILSSKSQTKPPTLEVPDDELWDVYVTHVHSTMNVCLRLLGDEYSARFDDLVTNMELHYFNTDKMPSVFNPTVGKLYAAKVDGEWHRIEVTGVRGIDVSCYFIDHGDEDELKVADLKELPNDFLALAPQAKHVRLAGLEDFRESTSAIADLTSMALGRSLVGGVHTNDNDGVSLVLWDTSGQNEDININETLLQKSKGYTMLEDEAKSIHSSMPSLEQSPDSQSSLINLNAKTIEKSPPMDNPLQHNDISSTSELAGSGPARNLVSVTQAKVEPASDIRELMRMDLSSFKPLTRAVLPDAEDFFDVTITLAGSPSNFTVQPYNEGKSLETLQKELNKFYDNPENNYDKGPLTSSTLSKDYFFAGKHDDGQWYRVKVNSMLDEYSAAVKLVDYGDYCMMQLENMQPLWPQFRHLSMQAISASLAGIIATHGDWTPDDTVWFAQRVVNEQFVSKIKDVIWDMNDHDACGNGFKLSLSLFDTSNPNEDVVIEKLLVDAGKAVYLCV